MCIGLVAVPVSIGLATLVLPVGQRRPSAPGGPPMAQKFGTGC